MLSIMGAFQRANLYRPNTSEMERVYFRRMLKGYLDNMINMAYHKPVEEEVHIEHIKSICRYTEGHNDLLENGKLNFGISQKLLNLYLKYHWCMGLIPTPPHFPVDSIIQKKLDLKVIPWTKMTDENDYLSIINSAKINLKKYNCDSLAELELLLFVRNT